MDSALNGFIESGHSVSSKDHDALEVFQLAEKNGYQRVVVKMLSFTAFKKDICFVEEENGFPASY